MARPRATDPAVRLTLRLSASLHARIQSTATTAGHSSGLDSVQAWVLAVIESALSPQRAEPPSAPSTQYAEHVDGTRSQSAAPRSLERRAPSTELATAQSAPSTESTESLGWTAPPGTLLDPSSLSFAARYARPPRLEVSRPAFVPLYQRHQQKAGT